MTAGIGIVLNSIEATMQTEGLLKQSQQLATELQTQQNELQLTNEQLEQKAQQLAEQNAEVERKNQEIEQARRALEEKAAELALTSKYKSEFLANMSHELRTPLNSILILGQQLSDNPDGNLSPRQVEFARTIHGAGTDLLNLISDILDLSKIESGTVSVDAEEIVLRRLEESVTRPFRHEAERRGLSFDVSIDPALRVDHDRLEAPATSPEESAVERDQVHRARRGELAHFARDLPVGAPDHPVLSTAPTRRRLRGDRHRHRHPAGEAAHHLRGVPAGRRQHPRRYGGTGLGLAISRELVEPARRRNPAAQQGRRRQHVHALSAADLCRPAARLPVKNTRADAAPRPRAPRAFARVEEARAEAVGRPDRRSEPGDATSLIVEDDPHYARLMVDLAHDAGLKVLVAAHGADALALARQFTPMAISLDVFLPDMLGWAVLSQLKQDPHTRHIPVQIVTLDEDWQHGLASGAFSFTNKPTTMEGLKKSIERLTEYARPRRKRLLVVEDNAAERLGITNCSATTTSKCHRGAGRGSADAVARSSRPIAWCWT